MIRITCEKCGSDMADHWRDSFFTPGDPEDDFKHLGDMLDKIVPETFKNMDPEITAEQRFSLTNLEASSLCIYGALLIDSLIFENKTLCDKCMKPEGLKLILGGKFQKGGD